MEDRIVSMGIQDERNIATCEVPATLEIPADVSAGAINQFTSITTTANGVVTIASTGVDAGNNPLVVAITPALTSGSLA